MKKIILAFIAIIALQNISAQNIGTRYLYGANFLHYHGSQYHVIGSNIGIIDTTYCKQIASQTGDSVFYQIIDSAKSTGYVAGDSIIMLWNFRTSSIATLDFQYWQTDTLEDSVEIFGNNKLLSVFVPKSGNSGKANTDIYFTFVPSYVNGNSSMERFTFKTRKKKPSSTTATKNKFLFNYISQ